MGQTRAVQGQLSGKAETVSWRPEEPWGWTSFLKKDSAVRTLPPDISGAVICKLEPDWESPRELQARSRGPPQSLWLRKVMVWSRIYVSTNAWVTLRWPLGCWPGDRTLRTMALQNRGENVFILKTWHMSSLHRPFPLSSLSCFFPSSFIRYVLLEHRVWARLTR